MICIKDTTGSFSIVSDNAIKTLSDQLLEAIIAYRYDRQLYRIAIAKNCPKVEPAIMGVIWSHFIENDRLASEAELLDVMRNHPDLKVEPNEKLGTSDEILRARVYNMWSSSFREVDVMLNLHQWTPKAQILKDLDKDLTKGTDLIYRVNGFIHVFDIRHLGESTDIHRLRKRVRDNPNAIVLVASYPTRGGELHLVPEKDYRHYAEISEED